MSHRIKVEPIQNACQCPWYTSDTKGNRSCFHKNIVTLPVAMSMVQDNDEFNPSCWNKDCGGQYAHCSFLRLLYTGVDKVKAEAPAQTAAPEPPAAPKKVIASDTKIDDWDPFEDDTEEETSPAVIEETPQVEQPEPKKEKPEAITSPIKVVVRKVKDIYSAKCDALIYPTNQELVIDDGMLNYRTKSAVQRECDEIIRRSEVMRSPVALGGVYETQGGNGIAAARIYHAVVATPSRLVNDHTITRAVVKALMKAERDGLRVVAMLPCDCATYDIYQTAHTQLSAIYNFLKTTKVKNLQAIYIIMNEDDEVSLNAFKDYFERTFGS